MAENVKTVSGVAIANVKTIAGVAIADVKTIAGVDNTGSGGSPAFVQAQTNVEYFNSDNAISVTLPAPVTAGNSIAVQVTGSDITQTITVADDLGNTYTMLGSPVDGGTFTGQGAVLVNLPSSGTCTITATFSGANSNKTIKAVEVSGVSGEDGNNTKYVLAGAGTDVLICDNFTTSQDGCILVGMMMSPGQSGNTITAGTGFTMRESDNTNNTACNNETRIQATASGSTNVAFSSNGFGDAMVTGIAFKP